MLFTVSAMSAIVAAQKAREAQLRRARELKKFAEARDWPFDASKDEGYFVRYGHFSLFIEGRDRYAFNTVRGALGVEDQSWPIQCGDYHFETLEPDEHQPKPKSHRLSYVLLETPYLGLPDLVIRPERLYDKVASLFGREDINFESAEFNARFVVNSRDKRFAYDVLHPGVIQFLLDRTPPVIDFRLGQCCLSMGEKCWAATEFEAVFGWAAQFFELWPRHVTTSIAERLESPRREGKG